MGGYDGYWLVDSEVIKVCCLKGVGCFWFYWFCSRLWFVCWNVWVMKLVVVFGLVNGGWCFVIWDMWFCRCCFVVLVYWIVCCICGLKVLDLVSFMVVFLLILSWRLFKVLRMLFLVVVVLMCLMFWLYRLMVICWFVFDFWLGYVLIILNWLFVKKLSV